MCNIAEGKILIVTQNATSNVLHLFQHRGDWCLWDGSGDSGPAPCLPQTVTWVGEQRQTRGFAGDVTTVEG